MLFTYQSILQQAGFNKDEKLQIQNRKILKINKVENKNTSNRNWAVYFLAGGRKTSVYKVISRSDYSSINTDHGWGALIPYCNKNKIQEMFNSR